MTTETFLYILIAGIFSLALAVFMYGFRSKQRVALKWILGGLRFITLFLVLILLINPKIKSETYTVDKPKLPILIDNSASVAVLKQEEQVLDFIKQLQENEALNDKFDLSYYSFGSVFKEKDSLKFNEKNTNISKALSSVNELFKNEIAPTLLISDGNQTLGSDYEFSTNTFKNPIYSIILGDSIKHTDLKIEQLNTNRYAFLKNQFPVEVILSYSGNGNVNSEFIIKEGETTVYKTSISFSEKENSKTLSFTLPANKVGLQKYNAEIIPLEEEKNKTNNSKQFAVEVIDQATNVLLVSSITHPDIGALKKAITSSEYRSFSQKTPSEAVTLLNDYQLILLYQPNRNFDGVYKEIQKLNKNTFVISGTQTDWSFLNSVQKDYKKQISNQTERISGVVNPNYNTFALGDINIQGYPPLKTKFGNLAINSSHEILMTQSINGILTNSPLLVTMEEDGKRNAIWDAEGMWRWRAESFVEHENFTEFDDFIGKLIQYLASNKRRSRLEVQSESFYYNHAPIKISAQYFDKNHQFDDRLPLQISITNLQDKKQQTFPLLLRNKFFEVDLSSLEAGEYNFNVSVTDENMSRSGSFTILEFNVEQQFLNADIDKLEALSKKTNAESYFISESDKLIKSLLEDNRYQNIQKSELKILPLIDWKYLLAILVLTLSAEWFIRKYNGLI